MKKTAFYLMATCMSLVFYPIQTKASSSAQESSGIFVSSLSDSTESNVMMARIDQINEMDKSNLSYSEKKNLRAELTSMKSEAKSSSGSSGGVVYISAGGIILILLLLIILF